MGNKMRKGALIGLGLAVFIILTQPFHPEQGLIPELVSFFTTVPIWLAVIAFPGYAPPPLAEACLIMIYLLLVGALIGGAFEFRPIWAWFLVVALIIHHYIIDVRIAREMTDILPALMNYFH